ncbi:hypothetical protein P5V15_012539 [Pogonomyrmex californicus]
MVLLPLLPLPLPLPLPLMFHSFAGSNKEHDRRRRRPCNVLSNYFDTKPAPPAVIKINCPPDNKTPPFPAVSHSMKRRGMPAINTNGELESDR